MYIKKLGRQDCWDVALVKLKKEEVGEFVNMFYNSKQFGSLPFGEYFIYQYNDDGDYYSEYIVSVDYYLKELCLEVSDLMKIFRIIEDETRKGEK